MLSSNVLSLLQIQPLDAKPYTLYWINFEIQQKCEIKVAQNGRYTDGHFF